MPENIVIQNDTSEDIVKVLIFFGQEGPKGDTGDTGADSTVAGPQGDTGNAGEDATPAGSANQVQFNAGGSPKALGADSSFVWDPVNKRLGIGTTTPNAAIDVRGDVNSSGNLELTANDKHLYFRDSSANLVTGLYVDTASRMFLDNNRGQLTIVGSSTTSIRQSTVNTSVTLSSVIIFTANGTPIGRLTNVGLMLGNSSSPNARLQIKGVGATAATDSLLIENSAGTQLVKVQDNGIFSIGTIRPLTFETEEVTGVTNYSRIKSETIKLGISGSQVVQIDAAFRLGGVSGFYSDALLDIGANTASKAHINLTKGVAYTGTKEGSIWYRNEALHIYTDSVETFLTKNSNGNVGIGTTTPAATSILDLTSTTKGFLPPRMTTAQRDAISSPATLLMIANTTTTKLNYYDGSAWVEL
jgi:hypothetical protein